MAVAMVAASRSRFCSATPLVSVAAVAAFRGESRLRRTFPPNLLLQQQHQHRRRLNVLAAARKLFTELRKMKADEDDGDAGPVAFESPLGIVLYPDPRLRARNIRINAFDQMLQKLVAEMLELMYRTDGVGLSAPQVGVNVRLMVFNPAGEKGKGQEYIFVNPKITKYSKERDIEKEGCLSFYSIEADVERSTSIRIDAQDINGKRFGTTFRGWTARIFQHEYDHLESVLYFERMSPAALSTIEKDLLKMEKDYEEKTGLPTPETIKRNVVTTA